MTEAILHPLNVPVRYLTEENTWAECVATREAFDIKALNARLKSKPIVGEFNPVDFSTIVDKDNVCLRIDSLFVSDGMLMGIIVPHGPKGDLLQRMIDARTSLVLTMRATRELSPNALASDTPRLKKIVEVIAFDIHLP